MQFTDAGQCESIFRVKYQRDEKGNITVPLPFRKQLTPDSFPSSQAVAISNRSFAGMNVCIINM